MCPCHVAWEEVSVLLLMLLKKKKKFETSEIFIARFFLFLYT